MAALQCRGDHRAAERVRDRLRLSALARPRDIALIRRLTDKPVSKLATTHWHFDHNYGASAYRDAFPEVELIAERESARWIELNQTWWGRMSTAPDSTRRGALAELERALERGSGADNVPFSAAERTRRADIVRRRRGELEELATIRVIPPNRLFDGRLSLDFEGTRIEIQDRGPANSPHDTTFWLPQHRILFAGDILVKSPLPYTGASWPVHWVPVLRAIEAIPVAQLVPGHGPVMQDHVYNARGARPARGGTQRVEAMTRPAGRSPRSRTASISTTSAPPSPSGADPTFSADDWTYTRRTLAERSFVGLRGQGGARRRA
jgi:glyoxylase-like metal-dependent hydrolase (beta-lactamase superfamily II)